MDKTIVIFLIVGKYMKRKTRTSIFFLISFFSTYFIFMSPIFSNCDKEKWIRNISQKENSNKIRILLISKPMKTEQSAQNDALNQIYTSVYRTLLPFTIFQKTVKITNKENIETKHTSELNISHHYININKIQSMGIINSVKILRRCVEISKEKLYKVYLLCEVDICKFSTSEFNNSNFSTIKKIQINKRLRKEISEIKNKEKYEPTMTNILLVNAIKNNLKKEVENLLKNGVDLNQYDTFGKTPLIYAIINSNFTLITTLIKYGANVNLPDKGNNFPLHYVFYYKNCDFYNIFKLLLDSGADPNVQNKQGETPLHLAIKYGCIKIAQILLKYGANPDIQNRDGNTPLHLAVKLENTAAVKILLKNRANPNITNFKGLTPLELAKIIQNREITKLLKNHCSTN